MLSTVFTTLKVQAIYMCIKVLAYEENHLAYNFLSGKGLVVLWDV